MIEENLNKLLFKEKNYLLLLLLNVSKYILLRE